MTTCAELMVVLEHHVGRLHGITAGQLAARLNSTPRRVRQLITVVREAGVPICGHPTTGYFVAETADEIEETCRFLRSRALHSLVLEARLRKTTPSELLGQMRLGD